MSLKYTDSFSVDTTGVKVNKGASPGNGVIPDSISIKAVTIVPDKSGDSFPTYYLKGIDSNSDWVKVDPDTPSFTIEGLGSNTDDLFYIKADSGTITVNLYVKG